jgi:hypothetical protein
LASPAGLPGAGGPLGSPGFDRARFRVDMYAKMSLQRVLVNTSGAGMRDDGDVLSVAQARALRDAGLQWTPAPGDSFVIPDREMDSDVFVLSDMTIEVHQFPAGPVIGFNGTTEWALDSVAQSHALWMPAEHQLRERLGEAFAGLAPTGDGYRVTLRVDGTTSGFEGRDPTEAYARALLHLLTSQRR